LLPGALIRNSNLKFICQHINIRVENIDTAFTSRCQRGQVLSVPIAHGDGNYFCDDQTLAELQSENRIIFRYSDPKGTVTSESNPNGSIDNIAGICNRERHVLGMMPHPERASEDLLGSIDGRIIFCSLADTLAELAKAS
jgi:phosphoribosylformylglycinamidine synthase